MMSLSTTAAVMGPPRSEVEPSGVALELVAFTIVGIGLYFAADGALRHLERARGAAFEHRSIIFFAMLLSLAVVIFALIRAVAGV